MIDTFQPVRDFEAALCEYTGAPYAVAVHRCTVAITLCCMLLKTRRITIPSRTYAGVPQAILWGSGPHGQVRCEDIPWRGAYKLEPYPIWDAARRFRAGMYDETAGYVCLSFHRSKILGHTEGGAILTDNKAAADWLRLARDNGRSEDPERRDSNFVMVGLPAYMIPEVASALLQKLVHPDFPKDNPDLPNSNYADLSLTDWNALWGSR